MLVDRKSPPVRFRRGFTALESVVMLFVLTVFTLVILGIVKLKYGWPLGHPAPAVSVAKAPTPKTTPEAAPASSAPAASDDGKAGKDAPTQK